MAGITNYERVNKTIELLRDGLKPFVAREMKAKYGKDWITTAAERHRFSEDVVRSFQDSETGDIKIILELMWDFWHEVFRTPLGHAERSLVSELREIRNRWAHQNSFSTDDAYRVMDSTERLLNAISAPEAQKIAREKQSLMRERFEQQMRDERKKIRQLSIEGEPKTGLTPWREVITPHRDVASGNYRQAEFTADLGQVSRGEAEPEYNTPCEFFRRTYLTGGLSLLLQNALKQLCAGKGDPVIELQTNFGGGKTHSMIALYHLFSGESPTVMRGVEELVQKQGVSELPAVKRVVLQGQALSPGQPQIKPDGTEIRTLWGEMAWQLMGKTGFELLAQSDQNGTNPGSDVLRELFQKSGACLILIDEWVAYVRQLFEKNEFSGGSFEANMTFAQSLTEAARAVPHVLVVASLPASRIEIGGEGGKEALNQLKHIFGRMESPWRPASADESFEIVRRRLFEEITDTRLFAVRDAVIDAYCDLYARQPGDFPTECREGEYRRRMQACYPVHPELFDRLYEEWSSLDKFQRTRGVLRLMAATIHSLWETQDAGLLIMSCSVPISDPVVQSELVNFLEEKWVPVIEKDIDGPRSLSLRLDRDNPNMGRYSACRRVARTIYMASAPTVKTSVRGADDRQIRLGCVQPGESPAIFGDALRRLADQAMHLYMDQNRYWYSTQPSVMSIAKDRSTELKPEQVCDEIIRRITKEHQKPGDFLRVHACPATSSDVADAYDTRLVILSPLTPHIGNQPDSPAIKAADEILLNRGNSPRQYRNTLVFLAPEKRKLQSLEDDVREYLAWRSVDQDKGSDMLNLDAFQAKLAENKSNRADDIIRQKIPETWEAIIAPYQTDPKSDKFEWKVYKPMGSGSLAERVSTRLVREQSFILKYAGTALKLEMDRIPLWRGNHVEVRQLREDFARYIYLPRLQSADILMDAIADGISLFTWQTDTFAYADSWDNDTKRYPGLRAGESLSVRPESDALVVKSEIAAEKMVREKARAEKLPETIVKNTVPQCTPENGTGNQTKETTSPCMPRRFYGTCQIDPTRMTRDIGLIADEVIQHLTGLLGSEVRVSLEIHAKIPDGVPENIVRTVTENSRTLKFEHFEFEEE